MKKLITILTLVSFCLCNCSPPEVLEECLAMAWVGTFNIIEDTACEADPNSIAANSITFTLGNGIETIRYADKDLQLDDCRAEDNFFTFNLDGNQLFVQVQNCSWTYERE